MNNQNPTSAAGGTQLPPYSRSILAVELPVAVTLATTQQSVQEIVELAPGSLINFDKSCDDLLELTIGDHAIAKGEVVKVGDKFGLRIQTMILPQEHFQAIDPAAPDASSAKRS